MLDVPRVSVEGELHVCVVTLPGGKIDAGVDHAGIGVPPHVVLDAFHNSSGVARQIAVPEMDE